VPPEWKKSYQEAAVDWMRERIIAVAVEDGGNVVIGTGMGMDDLLPGWAAPTAAEKEISPSEVPLPIVCLVPK
jgi:hypothetical protein